MEANDDRVAAALSGSVLAPHGANATIREATTDDVAAVLALWEQARSENASTPDTPEALTTLLTRSPGALLVAEHERDGIVGAIVAGWDGWRGNMYRLAVHPEHRRRGVALSLARHAEAQLRRQGATRITALVAHEELHAVEFWTRAGYRRDTTIARFVKSLTSNEMSDSATVGVE